jgi:hypothetical protein
MFETILFGYFSFQLAYSYQINIFDFESIIIINLSFQTNIFDI